MKKLILLNLLFCALIFAFAGDVIARTNPAKQKATPKKETTQNIDNLATVKGSLDKKEITFNFPNAKLVVFARFVGRLSGKVLIGEDLLKGNINIKSEGKLNLKEVKELFMAVLYSQGLDMVETDLYMEIVQRSNSYVKAYKLDYLKSADVAKSLTLMFRMSFRVGSNPQNIQISSLDDANAILVLAPKNQQLEIEKTIKKMDVRTRQVLLNIMVVEITKTSDFGFGVDFRFNDGKNTIGTSSGGTTPAADPTIHPMSFGSSINTNGGFLLNSGNWFLNIQGIDNNTKIKTLSQPRILTADNQKAQIKIGQKQPYVTVTSSLDGGQQGGGYGASVSSSISTDDVGTDIEITPTINNLNDVTLDTKLKITSIVGQLSVENGATYNSKTQVTTPITNNVPQIGHRIINNTSSVANGEVIAIGGLLKSEKTTTKIAPPILGDIPLLGWIFSKESESYSQIELMILISPQVVNNPEETRTVTKNETKKLRNYDPEEKGKIDNMLARKKALTDGVFSMFDYFTNDKYRSEQDFIPQPGRL